MASVRPDPASPARVARELRRRLEEGARLRPAGSARERSERLLSAYPPRSKLQIFDTTWYLARVRQNADIRFFVGYLVRDREGAPGRSIYPRIFYKDVSLIWRSASHYVRSARENWIGKGALQVYSEGGEEYEASNEATTDLPLEVQTAFESLSRNIRRIRRDEAAIDLVLRRGPDTRLEAYRDFTEPRRRARSNPRNRVNGERPIARFDRRNDPTSLRFTAGFAPDLGRGILEVSSSRSRLYGGRIRRYRVLSVNRHVQYLFMAGPRHVWIVPAQATTTDLSSYGVRTIDVIAAEDLFLPGYEYHSEDEALSGLASQIPPGFAGAASEQDPSRADTSRWLEQLPIVQAFRRKVLQPQARRN